MIDGFTTEYVLEELETPFQKFITDDSEIPGSPAEASFFADMDATKYVWLKDDLNKEFFRFLRNQKLLHPKVVMCGLDAKSSPDKSVRQATFAKMPRILIDAIKRAFRMDLQSMIDRADMFYDREPMMALNATNCIAKSNRAVIHVGSNHAWSIHYDNTMYQQKTEPPWRAFSQFIHALLPNKKIVTTFTAQPLNEEVDPLMNALVAANAVFHKSDLTRLSLLPTYSASPQIKSLLQMKLDSGEMLPIWPVWDYLILGPKGDRAPLWSN